MISISLCMIVKNEQKVLKRCLSSVKDLVDEIIIVDTGSTDNTKEIAKEFTDLIYDFEWTDDFSEARNFSFSKATKEYQLWLDASDFLEEIDRESFRKLKTHLIEEIDVVTMNHCTEFDENGEPLNTFVRERLVKRDKKYVWHDPVREYINADGVTFYADDIFIMHKKDELDTGRDIKIYDKQIELKKDMSPRTVFFYAKELKNHERYIESAFYFDTFLSMKSKDAEDNIEACFELGQCYKSIGEKEKSIDAFLKSFRYHGARAEICCEIAYYFKDKQQHSTAIYWFHLASNLEKPDTIGFMLDDYWGYIPNVELVNYCLSASITKVSVEQAIYHNQLAKKFKPNSKIVLHNEHNLATLLKKI